MVQNVFLMTTNPSSARLRVWDLPTRLFHWALAACVIGLFATAWAPGSWIEWHARLGYAVLTLLLFRLAWGFLGGHWSRFAQFLPHPRRIGAYLKGRPHPDDLLGHNPVGALAIFAMLLALLVQVGTGLVSDDEIAFTGPLNRFVSTATGLAATAFHHDVGKLLVLALVVLHLAAVAFYRRVRRIDLLRPMLHGDKIVTVAEGASLVASRDDGRSRLLALGVLALCAGAVALLLRMAG